VDIGKQTTTKELVNAPKGVGILCTAEKVTGKRMMHGKRMTHAVEGIVGLQEKCIIFLVRSFKLCPKGHLMMFCFASMKTKTSF